MEDPYHYRNKVHAAFGRLRDGRIVSGIYQEGTHKIVPVDSCLIEDQTADSIIRDIRGLLASFKIKIYNEDSGYGLLRHVLIRRGFATGQVLVALVLASPILPSKKQLCQSPAETAPGDHHRGAERQRQKDQHGAGRAEHHPLRQGLH